MNDDFAATPIHTIQGSGNASPFAGNVVTTIGIVTGVKSNGFFIQDPMADADPNTSEGIFVFTSSAPPAAAAVGNSVAVMGMVQEFIPSADRTTPLTEIAGTPAVTLLSTETRRYAYWLPPARIPPARSATRGLRLASASILLRRAGQDNYRSRATSLQTACSMA
jgi:hypothetical protein